MRLVRLDTSTTRVDFLDLHDASGVSVPEPGQPLFALAPPAPNPTGAQVQIDYSLATAATASLAVYDVSGRKVSTLVSGFAAAGPNRARWEARDDLGRRVPAGMYFVRLSAAGRALVRSIVVLP